MRNRWTAWMMCGALMLPAVAAAQTPDGTQAAAPQQNDHPEPAHTGWSSLVKDTARDFIAFPQRQSTWVLLAMGGGGALLVHPADDDVAEHVSGNDTAEKV